MAQGDRFPVHFQMPHKAGIEGFLEHFALLSIKDYLDGVPEAMVGESEHDAWADFFSSELFYFAYKLCPLVWEAVREYGIDLYSFGFVEHDAGREKQRSSPLSLAKKDTKENTRQRHNGRRIRRKIRTEIIAEENNRRMTFTAIAACAHHYRVSEDTVRWALRSKDGRLGPRAENLKGRYVYITKGRTFYSR